jgi:hypothetical protein
MVGEYQENRRLSSQRRKRDLIRPQIRGVLYVFKPRVNLFHFVSESARLDIRYEIEAVLTARRHNIDYIPHNKLYYYAKSEYFECIR